MKNWITPWIISLFSIAATVVATADSEVKISLSWSQGGVPEGLEAAALRYYAAYAVDDAASITAQMYAPHLPQGALVPYERPLQWGAFDTVHILRHTRLNIDGQAAYLLSGVYGDCILQSTAEDQARTYLYAGFQDVWVQSEGRWLCIPGSKLAGATIELPSGAGQWAALTSQEFDRLRSEQKQAVEQLKRQREQAAETAVQRALRKRSPGR